MLSAPLLAGPNLNANQQRFWMLSALEDWLPPWRAGTAYLAGQGIVDPNGNVQVVEPGGVSGAAAPTWSTDADATTVDGSVIWLNQGPDTSQVGLYYCNFTRRLQLRSLRTGRGPSEDFVAATALVETAPMTFDTFGNYARYDSTGGVVVAGGSGPSDAPPPDEVPIYWPAQPNVTDLAMGYDGVLYIAAGGALVLVDRRNRWPNFTLSVPDFSFWRLVALSEGGVLALDRSGGQLGKVSGAPLPSGPVDVPDPGVLRPCQANPNPPRLVSRVSLPGGEYYVAIAALDPAQSPLPLALLSWAANSPANPTAYVRLLTELTIASPRFTVSGVRWPYSLSFLGGQKLALLATGLNEALVYDLSNQSLSASNTAESLLPTGDTYLLLANSASAPNAGPFLHGFSLPPSYTHPGLIASPAHVPTPVMLPLVPLSLNALAARGATHPAAPAVIDSGVARQAWHRVFLEAVLPARTGGVLWLSASDQAADLYATDTPWYPHLFGDADASAIGALLGDTPRAVWQSVGSEVPFAPTLLGGTPADNVPAQRQGLFMVLVQRAGTAVRNLQGRFLGVRIALNGDGRVTPQVAGMRIYGPRFSYVQNYLPQLYHEEKFGDAADAAGPSTRRDFLERFLYLFEAQFTRIEDFVANAYRLTRSEATPPAALPWLGGWLGIDPDDGYPPDRARERIDATPRLYRSRGTARGIRAALDVATGGMCSRGAIIVIEDYRLRHLFATIIGADLSVRSDPLLPGYYPSSNSIVGDTLFLGDPGLQAELQALYEQDLGIAGDAAAAQAFYDRLALRMTVFVHDEVENVSLNLVRGIVEAEKPAHVQVSVRLARAPFMVGLASLLGVNSYLGPHPPAQPARVDVSDVGRYDVVRDAPSLDPRLENGAVYAPYPAPIARIKAPLVVGPGETITLDASASTAPAGATITTYEWSLVS